MGWYKEWQGERENFSDIEVRISKDENMKRKKNKEQSPDIIEFRRWAIGYGYGLLTVESMVRAALSYPPARDLIKDVVSIPVEALCHPSLPPDPLPPDDSDILWPIEIMIAGVELSSLDLGDDSTDSAEGWEPDSLKTLVNVVWLKSDSALWVRSLIAETPEELVEAIGRAVAAAKEAVPAQAEAIDRLGRIMLEQACAHLAHPDEFRRVPIFIFSHPGYGASYVLRIMAKALGSSFLTVGDDQTQTADLVKESLKVAPPLIQVHGIRSSDRTAAMNSIVSYCLHGHTVIGQIDASSVFDEAQSSDVLDALLRKSFIFFRLTPPLQPADSTDYTAEEMVAMMRDSWKRLANESFSLMHVDDAFWTLIRDYNSVVFRRTPIRFLVRQLRDEFSTFRLAAPGLQPRHLEPADEMRLAALFILERGYPSPKDIRGAARRFVLSLSADARNMTGLELHANEPEWQAIFRDVETGSDDWLGRVENMARQFSYRGYRLTAELAYDSASQKLRLQNLAERSPKAVTGGVFLQSRPTHRFRDVAGHEEAKTRFQQILTYFRDPEPFRRLGVIPPLRILLHGAPGTGKTLLAKALAGESGLPFFAISAGEFMTQEYAGQGAGLMRQFFQTAETCRPCIIFMDELDALGKRDSMSDSSAGVDYRATLNTLLTLLDGIQTIPDILVIGATNRPDDIDSALTRPGRFGTHIEISKLTVRDRERLIRKNLAPEHCGDDYDELVRYFCRRTTGELSAAEIVQIITESKLQAIQEGQAKVTRDLLVATADRILLGKKLQPLQEDLRRSTAIHEAGHALLCRILLPEQKIDRVTIGHRETSLGLVRMLDDEEHLGLQSRDELLCHLLVRLGGVTAEEVIVGHWDLGGSDDFDMAVAMARHALSNLDLGGLGLRSIVRSRFESEAPMGGDMEELTVKMMEKCRRAVAELLQNHKEALLHLAEELERREDLDQEDVDGLLRGLKVDRPAILGKLLAE